MELALQIVAGVFCVPLLALGLKCTLKPHSMLDNLGLDPRGPAGLNTIRGMVGGVLLACVAMIVLGLATGETVWLLAVAVVMAVAALGRALGVVVDGFDRAVIRPLVVEIVIAVVLVGAHLQLA